MTHLASRRPRARRALLTVAAVTVAVLLAGCTPDPAVTPTPTATTTPSATPTPVPTTTPTPEPVFAPLTGVEVEAPVAGPALAAKIDNHWDARPQWGLERTDIVFEELVEGGLTRYVAVWHSDVPAQIGPVRSIRPMDPDIIAPLGGIVAYSGGQARFVSMMQRTDVHNSIHGGKDDRFMFRSIEKRAPHNVVVEAQKLRAAYDDLAEPQAQFGFSPRGWAPQFGTASAGIDLSFARESPRSWRFDAASNSYLRSQDGAIDRDSHGAQLSATNVVVMQVSVDWSYGIVPRTVMVGTGKAWVSTGGKVMQVTWRKPAADAPIELINATGVTVRLAPGNTWVQLVPDTGSISILD